MGSLVEVNKRSLLVRVENRYLKQLSCIVGKKKPITGFSRGSQRRLARLLLNNAERFRFFFTVTYRENQRNCKESKEHLDYFLTRLRKLLGSKFGYVWVLEFQRRGAVHFHFWLDDFKVGDSGVWESLPVRENLRERFKKDVDSLARFRCLSHLWLTVSNQLDDDTTVLASTDLKRIESNGFVASYASKYFLKVEQKVFAGNIDEGTGEILDKWVGRYWGAPRCVQNEKRFVSEDPKLVRIFRRWMKSCRGWKDFSGMYLVLNAEMQVRLATLCDNLDAHGARKNSEKQ